MKVTTEKYFVLNNGGNYWLHARIMVKITTE